MTNISVQQQNPNPYGNVYKLGDIGNNRVGYRLIDGRGNMAGKISVSSKDSKKFEQAYIDIRKSNPDVQEYAKEVKTKEGIRKIRLRALGIGLLGGLAGTAIPLYLTKGKSKAVRIASTVSGILVGLIGGFITAVSTSIPKPVMKSIQALRTLNQIDIQPYNDAK